MLHTLFKAESSSDSSSFDKLNLSETLSLLLFEGAQHSGANLDETDLHYLPKYGDSLPEECFADLSNMAPVPKRYFRPEAVQARLSTAGVRQLQMHIAEFYGRPFGFNSRDRSPYSAEFACERCFYDAFRLTKVPVNEGEHFPLCRFCGDEAMWIRLTDAVQVPMEFPPNG
jgi:hypothetical protein